MNVQILCCSKDTAIQLTGLGIWPMSFFKEDKTFPVWTMEELSVLIGNEFQKPEIQITHEWQPKKHLKGKAVAKIQSLRWRVYLPDRSLDFDKGAEAYAVFLMEALIGKHIDAKDCNERYKKAFSI